MAGMSVYDGIISPNGGLYRPGPEVVYPRGESELTTRQVQTVAVDPFTGAPIGAGQSGNAPQVTAAMSARGGLGVGMRGTNTANFTAPSPVHQPDGSLVADKRQDRLGENEYSFAFGPEPEPNAAVAAIDGVTIPLPRPRPRTGFVGDPGSTGAFGQRMSPGMAQIIATQPQYASQRAGRLVASNPQVAQALAAQQSAPAPQVASARPTIVDPSTSRGSTLESMGFSSGGAVPAATVRNLEARGYI